MTSPKISIVMLGLASLALIPAAKAACAVSGTPAFSGGLGTDGNGNLFYTSSGGSGTVSISFTAASGCTYYVTSNSSWLTSTVSTSTQNSGASVNVTFNVAADSAAAGTRTGTLTVYVNATSVTSKGVDENSSNCVLTFTTPNQTLPAAGGNFTLAFNNGGCLYWGPSTPSWAPVSTYNANYVILSIAQNTGSARSGAVTMTSPSATYALNQAAPVSAPTLTSISPNSGARGASVPVTLTGTNFIAGASVSSGNAGVSVGTVTVVSSTQITTTFTISSSASLGAGNVTVTTGGGTTGAVSFTVTQGAPTLTSISPTSGAQGTSVPVTITGTNFIAGAMVVSYNGGITFSNVNVVNTTTITAVLSIAQNTLLSADHFAVTTSAGTTGNGNFAVQPGVPSIGSIQPNSGSPGTGVPITLTGNNFIGTTSAMVTVSNGVAVSNVQVSAGDYNSSSQLTATFTIAANASAGNASVTLTTPGGTSAPVNFTITASPPTLTSINPASGAQGTSVPVTLTGTNFIAGASVNPGNAAISVGSVNVVSSTQITTTFNIAPGATLGAGNVTVSTTAGTTAAIVHFTVNAGVPTLTSISPNSGAPGTSVPVTLTGTNFIAGAMVNPGTFAVVVNKVNVVSSTQITATFVIAPNASGSGKFTVSTPAGTSNAVSFSATALPPTLTSISPNSGAAGASVPVSLSGTNFVSGATNVNAGGGITANSVNVINSTQLNATFLIPAGASGSVNVSVTTPAGTSGNIPFSVTSPAPTISSVVPSSATAGGPSFNLTVNGSGFVSGAVVNWGSQALSTTVAGSGLLTASVAASLIATPGTVGITVTSGNLTTGAIQFTINPGATPLKLTCSPATGPSAEGVSYLATCTASGGTAPYGWSIGSGALPQGLAPSGTTGTSITISGTPTSSGPYSYSVKLTDSSPAQQTQTQAYSGTIAAPTVAITSLNCTGTNGPSTAGVRYADTCTSPNGTAPFTWSISAGALPGGLALNGSASGTATISGTPTAAGPYSYTLTVSDSTSPTPLSGSQVFSGSVAQAGSPTLTISPASLSFSYRADTGVPAPQSMSIFTTGASTTFTVGVTGSFLTASPSGGLTPGNISVSVVNVTGLAPGTYNGQVTVTASNVNPPSVTIPVTLTVQAVPQPQLTLGQTNFAYGLTQGSSTVQSQLLVTNPGGGVLSFTAVVTGCNCVAVSTTSGQASAGSPGAIPFTVTAAGLPPSTYNSQIVITPSVGSPVMVPVTTAVNSLSQSIVLTQTGLLFGTVAQGAAPPAQSFNIINAGQGTMNYTLGVQTLSGTPGWLSVNPSAGSVTAGTVSAPVSVTVNPAGLAAGQYYALVQVMAPNAGNSPQVISVLLNVVDPSQGAALVSPTGVLVGSVAGANLTGAVTVYNLSNQALNFASTVSTTDGGNWLAAIPTAGIVPAQGSAQVTVSGNPSALPSGTGQGVVRIGFSNGIVQSVGVSSLSIAGTASSGGLVADAQGCQSTSLVPTVIASIAPSFTVTQSQPVSLKVSVVDNCNNPVPSASVSANFSDGDPAVTLVAQGNSVWAGTWTPKTAQAQVNVTVLAIAEQGLKATAGTLNLTGTVQSAAAAEAPAPASALNSANASPATQISPGSWVTIFGDRMASGTSSASGPFPPSLVGTAVMIGSVALPLDYVGPAQVNALLPYSLTPNSTVSLAVQRSGTVSVPIAVTIADLGPAIFALNGAGTGQGAVTIASSGVLAAPPGAFPGSQPVARGDFLAIYCTGLGAVNNTPADGAPAPSTPPLATTLATPAVSIGGMPATVTYSGLAPGLVGLYQVNVQVPNNAPTGDAVSLTISVGSLTSNTVTVAVQ